MIYHNAIVSKKFGEVKQGQFGPYITLKIKHDSLPSNDKGYKEVTLFPSPEAREAALNEGDRVTLVEMNGKYKLDLDATPAQAANGHTPALKPAYQAPATLAEMPDEVKRQLGQDVNALARLYRSCWDAIHTAFDDDKAGLLSEEAYRTMATTVFITTCDLYRLR